MSFQRIKIIRNQVYIYEVMNYRKDGKVKQKVLKYLGKYERQVGCLDDVMKNYVLMRDGHKCKNCSTDLNLEIDHIIPILKGGDNSLNNLQVLCHSCNSKKSNKVLTS